MKAKKNYELQCSHCGKRVMISLDPYAQNSVFKVAHEWSATGVPYCPECTKEISTYTRDYETVLKAIMNYAVR